MSSKLTPLAIAVLALLIERPMHPYEMYSLMLARSTDRLVKVRPGSLYHTVERLARDDMIVATGTDREGARPERTSYAVTDAGIAAVQDWVSRTLAEEQHEYPHYPVALAEAHNLPRATVIDLLSRQLARLESECAGYDATLAKLRSGDPHPVPEAYWIDASYQVAILRAQRDWTAETIDRLKKKELEWPEPEAHQNHREQQV